jgi:uncharacterized protein YigE (DUF2233 family)
MKSRRYIEKLYRTNNYLLIILSVNFGLLYAQESPWRMADEGLHVGEFDSPQKAEIGDSKITIVKIDPDYYDFKLLSASENNDSSLTVRQWAQKHNLIAAVNAGMYQQDYRTSVGYMKNFDHVNNPSFNKGNTIFVFNALDSTVKPAQIIDRTCQDFETIRQRYHSMVQSIRMINCHQENVWSQQPKKWSMVVLGADMEGNILFIFSRSPYSVHDFINILLQLPISIYNAMYLEGGAEATLYFSAGDIKLEKFGSFENAFVEYDEINNPWPVPNVLGIVKKEVKSEK